jgi:UDP-N-acetyl-2-amino-2-deoxyglucuronate dehydrogenase
MISFGLIGCGRIGERHAENIFKQGRLIAVCDIDAIKAQQLADKYSVPYYTNHNELLSKENGIQVIAVCTPNGLHARHSIDSLHAGFHVICEKPMALSVKDCNDMIEAADKASRKLFVVKQNRFNPPVIAVKKLIEEKKLGRIFSVQVNCFWNRNNNYYDHSWKGTKELDGGTLYTQFSHFIDLLYWMIGDVKKVFAMAENFNHQGIIEFEDTGCVGIQFYNGSIGTLHYTVNSYGKNMEGSLTVFAEKGTVKVGGQYLNELEYQNIEGYTIRNIPAGNPANNYGLYQGSMSNHDKVYQDIIHVLLHGGRTTNGHDGLKTIEIIHKIYEAARNRY